MAASSSCERKRARAHTGSTSVWSEEEKNMEGWARRKRERKRTREKERESARESESDRESVCF